MASPLGSPAADAWIALMVGNSRLHWGAFDGDRWIGSWHSPHLAREHLAQLKATSFRPSQWQALGIATPPLPDGRGFSQLWLASVVKSQVEGIGNGDQAPWQLHLVTLNQVPLAHTYPSLGVDRALALVGAGAVYGWPVLVIDGGTALTFTAGAAGALVGGAILPGIALQLRSLHQATDQLPSVAAQSLVWPRRWAVNTPEAIASGILHSLVAGVTDFIISWWQKFPGAQVVITGGDGPTLLAGLSRYDRDLARHLTYDPDVGFWGLRHCRHQASQG
ncbi:MAG: pantothenate kinase [Cyanobacteria bacterium REEB459]|nr:pantothenate kinase [Cyanobacteria bacterium REEB459]